MSNELFISQYKNIYQSLNNFSYIDNRLILKSNNTTYIIPFIHVKLVNLNPIIYSLNPISLFQTLYILELFYKNDLQEKEEQFIKDYTNKYLDLNDLYLTNQMENVKENNIDALSIPIYTAYDEAFANSKCANTIQKCINEHSVKIEKGESKGPKLVLRNDSNLYINSENEENNILLGNTGLGGIFLILGVVIAASIFVAYYMVYHL